MNIEVKVIPGAKKNLVREEGELFGPNQYKVYLTAPPVDGKANKALVEILAGYFKVKKSQVNIIKGLKSRSKTISIDGI